MRPSWQETEGEEEVEKVQVEEQLEGAAHRKRRRRGGPHPDVDHSLTLDSAIPAASSSRCSGLKRWHRRPVQQLGSLPSSLSPTGTSPTLRRLPCRYPPNAGEPISLLSVLVLARFKSRSSASLPRPGSAFPLPVPPSTDTVSDLRRTAALHRSSLHVLAPVLVFGIPSSSPSRRSISASSRPLSLPRLRPLSSLGPKRGPKRS